MSLESRLKRSGITILGRIPQQLEALDPDGKALRFIADLHDSFSDRQDHLLDQREIRYKQFDNGSLPNFSEDTKIIRNDKRWRV